MLMIARTGSDPLYKLLKSHEVMQRLRITRSTYYRWIEEGKMKAYRVNGQLRVHADEVARMVRDYFE